MSLKTNFIIFAIGCLSLSTLTAHAQAVCPVSNQTVSPATTSAVCNGAFNFAIGTQTGVSYYLRNSANAVLSGPYAGTGSTISLASGNINVTSTLNVIGRAQSGALTFDGINDYVSIPYSSNFNFGTTTDLTFEATVKFSANQPNYTGIIAQQATATPWVQLVLIGNKIAAEVFTTVGSLTSVGTTTLNDGRWHRLALVINRANNTLKLYVDGLTESNVTNTALSGNFNTSNAVLIGNDRSVTLPFNGTIDEVRIWSAAQSVAQLNANAALCLTGTETNLIAYYPFENGSGSTLSDVAGADNNGTLTNMTNSAWTRGLDNCSTCSTQMSVTPVVAISGLTNQTISAATSSFCNTGSTTINSAGSETQANYYLSNSTTTVVQGPIAGSGNTFSFNTGTLGSTTTFTVTGKRLSGALDFDGVDDVIAVNETTALAQFSTTPMTMEAWVYPTNISGAKSVIRKEGSYALYLFNGRIYFEMYRNSGSTNYTITLGQTVLPVNQWSHIAASWQGGIYADIFLNGNSEVIGGGSSTNNNVSGLTIGKATIANQTFAGKLDEIRIWNTARTAAQIKANMRACLTGTETGLLLYYKLDESGTTIIDAAGGDNNGVLINSNQSLIHTDGVDNCGCSLQMAVKPTVVINATPIITANNSTICTGKNATIVPAGAGANGTYTITGGSFTVSPGSPTSYSVTGTSSTGCVSGNTAVANVAVNITPTLSINSATICSGNSVTLVPSGGGTYTITGGSYNVSPNVTSSYSVTGTGTNNCEAANIAVATIIVNTTPTLSLNSPAICAGNSATLIPSGNAGGTYSISGGNFTVSPTSTSSYSLTGTSAAGCPGSNTAVSTVTVNVLPVLSVNSGSICAGQSFSLIASGAMTYTYSGGSPNVSPSVTTDYSVTGTSLDGCVSANAAVSSVTVNTLPIVSVNSGSICAGQSFSIVAAGAVTYTYAGGASVVSPTSNSSYSVSGASAEGCLSANTAISTVSVNALPTVSVNSGSICEGQSFTISASGASTYTYSSGSTIVSPTSNLSVSVTGTSAEGCVSGNAAISSVTVNTVPVISVTSGSICEGQSFTITASGATTYSYSSGTNIVSPSSTSDYSVTGTSVEGCESSNTAVSTITVNATPTISVNSGSLCAGESFTIVAGGASSYTYSGGNTIVTPVSTTQYSITGTSAEGCVTADAAISSVTVDALPVITANSGSICEGQSFTITANGAGTYTYSGGSNIVSPTVNSSYSITGTSLSGCVGSNTAVISVVVNSNPVVAVNNGTVCSGSSFIILPTGALSFTYSSGSGTVTPAVTTSYSITGTDINGCVSQVAVSSVTVFDLPMVLAVTEKSTVCAGEAGILTASGAQSYTWNTMESGASISVSPIATTIYTVSGTDMNGCINVAAITQHVDQCTGLIEGGKDIRFHVYPNPSNGEFKISVEQPGKVSILNGLGQTLYAVEIAAGISTIDLKDFSYGLFFVNFTQNGKSRSVKMIRQ